MTNQSEVQIKCPKCSSTQLTANKKGFGLGNAAVGGLLLGPVGLLGGLIGGGKVKITCLNCGHEWKPGQQ
jgi:ribosomal protein S27E